MARFLAGRFPDPTMSLLASKSVRVALSSSVRRASLSTIAAPVRTGVAMRSFPKRFAAAAYSTHHDAPVVDFDPNAVTAMDKQKPPAPGADFRVAIVGAGNINFGSDEGPWNHSFRLEQYVPRLTTASSVRV